MKRMIPLFLSLLVFCAALSSKPMSEEETIKNLELDLAKHAGNSDADIAFVKSNTGKQFVGVDPLGHIYDQTPADVEKTRMSMKKADPDVQTSAEISDIKIRITGDSAIVTYSGTYNSTGHKDKRLDVSSNKFVTVHTWQKQSGKWKLLAAAAISTQPISAGLYHAKFPGLE